MNLTEAFQKMDLLESEDFNVSSSMDSADLRNFLDNDTVEDSSVDIIDIEKGEDEPLEDSYVGKIIVECAICHSKFYKDPEDIKIDMETGNCNVDEECPICFSQDGYKIIGKVAPYEEEQEIEDEIEEEEAEDDELGESYLREGKHLCSKDLDETIGGTLAGAAVGALKAKKDGKSMIGGAIKGGLIGSGASNIITGKGTTADYAKVGGGLGGIGGAMVGAGVGSVAGKYANAGVQRADNGLMGAITGQSKVGERLKKKLAPNAIDEDFESATIETDDEVITFDTDEEGKVTFSSDPKPNEDTPVVSPLEDEDIQEIGQAQNTDEEVPEEEVPAEEGEEAPEEEVDMDEFDEESFDDLGESYLRRVYENVNGYKTTKIASRNGKLIVEGIIKFNSGKSKKTSFIFESFKTTKSGKVKFIGENAQITRGRKAFTLTGNVKGKKFITESLNYNYRQKDSTGKSTRLYGTVRK